MTTKCRLDWCRRERMRDSLLCPAHTSDDWLNRLPAWRQRIADPAGTGATMGLQGKDLTNAGRAA